MSTDTKEKLDSDAADVQLASVLRILEDMVEEGKEADHVIEMLMDFRVALTPEVVDLVDSDYVTERIETAFREIEEEDEAVKALLKAIGIDPKDLLGAGVFTIDVDEFLGGRK